MDKEEEEEEGAVPEEDDVGDDGGDDDDDDRKNVLLFKYTATATRNKVPTKKRNIRWIGRPRPSR